MANGVGASTGTATSNTNRIWSSPAVTPISRHPSGQPPGVPDSVNHRRFDRLEVGGSSVQSEPLLQGP